MAWRSRSRVVLALAALAFGVPLALAAVGLADRFYARNLLFLVPLVAAIAAPALLKLRAVPLAAYLVLATATSLWTGTDWRYQQPDWRTAFERTRAVDAGAGLIVVTPKSSLDQAVARVYARRAPATAQVPLKRAWVIVEPFRDADSRGLGPADVPPEILAALPGARTLQTFEANGFRLLLVGTDAPVDVPPALPGAVVYPPAP